MTSTLNLSLTDDLRDYIFKENIKKLEVLGMVLVVGSVVCLIYWV